MAERSNAAVLKTVDCQRSGGSNPSLSAEMQASCLHFLLGLSGHLGVVGETTIKSIFSMPKVKQKGEKVLLDLIVDIIVKATYAQIKVGRQ